MNPILAIDPGAGGGFAWRDVEGQVDARAMPEGMTAQIDALRELAAGLPGLEAVIERAGYWFPGDHPNSACTFARHCGHIEAALYALGVPCRSVPPGVWMRSLGKLPKDKAGRKRAIREHMARRHPHLRVTLATADALGILGWSLERGVSCLK
jgi:hypothetical protein